MPPVPWPCHYSAILAKMALWWQGHGTGGIFYQCLWVTKLCAKFGCSRTPRTASAHKSFIVLRCMWKEPAPLRTYLGENSSPNMGNRRICPQIWSQISPQIWWIPKFGEKFVPKKPGNIYACMGSSSQGLQIFRTKVFPLHPTMWKV